MRCVTLMGGAGGASLPWSDPPAESIRRPAGIMLRIGAVARNLASTTSDQRPPDRKKTLRGSVFRDGCPKAQAAGQGA